MSVKKAVIPCAGFGTRFLPVTKAVPKEMLPIVDKPALHFIVEEAISSGIEEILIIISPQKGLIADYFKPNAALNKLLLAAGKTSEFDIVNYGFDAKISFAIQKNMEGSGKAVQIAEEFADGEPFAVLFGDDIIFNKDGPAATAQLISAFEKTGKSVVGCQITDEQVARRCGVMCAVKTSGKITEIDGIIEKPQGQLPSKLVSLGRFILTSDIFNAVENTPVSQTGEVYLTDAISMLAKKNKVVAYEFDGRRYDIGNKEGYLEATVEFALRDPKLGATFKNYLEKLIK